MVNRRGFLTTLGITTAGLVLDPERLLWVPGQRTWFLPTGPVLRKGDWVGNVDAWDLTDWAGLNRSLGKGWCYLGRGDNEYVLKSKAADWQRVSRPTPDDGLTGVVVREHPLVVQISGSVDGGLL